VVTYHAIFGRRRFVVGAVAALAAGCYPPTPQRTEPTAPPLAPEFNAWNQEARGILSDSLQTLRTFDAFQAFRVSTAQQSAMRQPAELMWDPPVSATWDEATHVTRGLRGRADQLVQAISGASLEPGLWRQRRTLADAAHDLVDLGDALMVYRDRVDVLPPGDANGALALLDRAWAQWEAVAGRWGVSRAESLPCAAS
jgi:hypothetical protein